MQSITKKSVLLLLLASLTAPATLLAQEDAKIEKKEREQIIITRKDDKSEKMTIVVDGDKITVNGKPVDELKDENVSIRRHKAGDVYVYNSDGLSALANMDKYNGFMDLYNTNANKAMLGVTTDKTEEGARVQNVSKGSAAEKAGIKEGDIIRKIDDKKIETPDDLSKAIKDRKPGDKVSVSYLRDKKEQKVTAELTKWKGVSGFSYSPGEFNLNFDDMARTVPRTPVAPRVYGQGFSWNSNGSPKLGLSVQDTDDGKGVKVLEVDEETNAAKAGIVEGDIITEVDGKAVNSTDEISKIIRDSKTKTSVAIKLERKGKTQTVDVKMPRKIRTADL